MKVFIHIIIIIILFFFFAGLRGDENENEK